MIRRFCQTTSRWRKTIICLFASVCLMCSNVYAASAVSLPQEFGAAFGNANFESDSFAQITRIGALDVGSMHMLTEQNSDESFTPTGGAVTTMTAYIALCETDINATIEITDEMLQNATGGIRAGLRSGDVVRIKDLVTTMIMTGAQDCAEALAIHISASEEAFVVKMNEYAVQLHMDSTSYLNATGAYNAEQKTSVNDLLRLAASLYTLETSSELFSNATVSLDSPDSNLPSEIDNRVMMIDPSRSLYDSRIITAYGAGSSNEEGFNTIVVAKVNEMDVIIACCTALSDRNTYQNISLLLNDMENSFKTNDVTENIRTLLTGVNHNGILLSAQISEPIKISSINAWQVADDAFSYELTDITDTPEINSVYAQAEVAVDDVQIATIPLLCVELPEKQAAESDETPTSQPEDQPDAASIDSLFTAEDEEYEQSIYDQWGWIYWITGGAVACSLFAALCVLITRKLK